MIAITGCCGYVGSMVTLELLRNGYSVTGFDNLIWGDSQKNVVLALQAASGRFRFLKRDIWDIDDKDLAGHHTVIHLAALVGAPLCQRVGDREVFHVNQTISERLVGLLSRSQRIIYANTNSGYGFSPSGERLTENSPVAPLSVYARSKLEGEKHVLSHPDSVSLRLATVFGGSLRPRVDLLVNHFCRHLIRWRDGVTDVPLTLYEGNYWRSAVHVRDVARCFMHVVNNDNLTGIYNVASEDCESIKASLAGRLADLLATPEGAIVSGEGTDPDQRNYRVSSEKLLRTGFSFHYALRDGARDMEALCGNFSDPEMALANWSNA